MNYMITKQTFNITGIHCRSCKILIESEVKQLPGIKNIEVDHRDGACRLEFDNEKISREKILKIIKNLNYGIADEKTTSKSGVSARRRLIIAGTMLLLFALGYYAIEHFGLFQILAALNERKIGYGLIFLIGLLVGFHCVGMCGGLVVTYSARHAASRDEKGNSFSPHIQYNAGRVISYMIIGGVLGGVGSFFGINRTFTGVITLLAGGFMLIMGLSLLTNFRWLDKIKPRTPDFIARFLYGQKHDRKPKGPFIIGLANGFMPCGPLQAIELYALASGSIARGALSMGIFSLGTVPLMFGFGSFVSLLSREKIGQIMKISGAIVGILGIFMLNRGLSSFGYTISLRQAPAPAGQTAGQTADINTDNIQAVEMNVSSAGFSPNILYVKKGIPVEWIVNGNYNVGCSNELILKDYNIDQRLTSGKNIITFTPRDTGEIKFSCRMGMIWGKFVVTD